MLKKIFLIFFIFFILPVHSETISGNVRQDEKLNKTNKIIDSKTEKPIQGAKIYIPDYNFKTKTNKEGRFELNAQIENKAIMQVEKDGYRPFSLTVDENITKTPMTLGIQKMDSSIAFIDSGIFHLGDDVYSKNSANCKQFKAKPMGPYYSSSVKLHKVLPNKQAAIVFGSIIGLDTKLAKEMGQNSIVSVYSSPLEIIFNGEKIGELHLNGDEQQIIIPNGLIHGNNEILIKTGKNLFQYNYTDYDDMEFANLRIEYQDRTFANK